MDPHDNVASDMTETPRDPFGPVNTFLGYVIAILAIAMLVYAISPAIPP
jgi:uncharacterized protein